MVRLLVKCHFQEFPDVENSLAHDTFKNCLELLQLNITQVAIPALDPDAVIGLKLKVLRYVINDDYLVDPKFDGRYSLENKLYVYESEDDLVREISSKDVPELIKQQPKIIRHWVQWLKDTWVQNIIIWLSPRLVYLFK